MPTERTCRYCGKEAKWVRDVCNDCVLKVMKQSFLHIHKNTVRGELMGQKFHSVLYDEFSGDYRAAEVVYVDFQERKVIRRVKCHD